MSELPAPAPAAAAPATATTVSAWSTVAAASAFATAAITARFATVLAPVAQWFTAFARLALIAPFGGLAAFAGWSAFGRCAAHRLVALGHGCPAGEPHAAFLVHAQALDPNLIA